MAHGEPDACGIPAREVALQKVGESACPGEHIVLMERWLVQDSGGIAEDPKDRGQLSGRHVSGHVGHAVVNSLQLAPSLVGKTLGGVCPLVTHSKESKVILMERLNHSALNGVRARQELLDKLGGKLIEGGSHKVAASEEIAHIVHDVVHSTGKGHVVDASENRRTLLEIKELPSCRLCNGTCQVETHGETRERISPVITAAEAEITLNALRERELVIESLEVELDENGTRHAGEGEETASHITSGL